MQVVLASASPRRKELLALTGLDFDIVIPRVDETITEKESPVEFCRRISIEKARNVSDQISNALVIAADTIVVMDDHIMGKPSDYAQAFTFLKKLSNRTHEVYTGYTILDVHSGQSLSRVISTTVRFREMAPEEINWYIATGEPMDKAGAYAIQGIGGMFIDHIEGSHTNVIGLPLSDLYGDLKKFGITTPKR